MADNTAFPGVRSVLRNGLFLTGMNWAEAIFRAAYVFAIARFLGPSEYGVWSYVIAAYMLGVSASMLGLDIVVAGRLGRDPRGGSSLLETSLALRLVLLVVAAMAIGAVALLKGAEPKVAVGLAVSLGAIFGRGIAMWSRPVFLGLERAGTPLRITLLCRPLEVALGLVLLFLTRDVVVLLILHSSSWLLEGLLCLLRARRLSGFTAPRFHRDETWPLVRAGLPLGIAASCVAAMNAAPVLLASELGAPLNMVAQVGIVIQFATLGVLGMQGFVGAAAPVVSRAVERKDRRLSLYGLVVAVVSVVGFGLLALLARLVGEPIVTGVLGQTYLTAAQLLPWAFVIAGLSMLPSGFSQEQALGNRLRPGLLAGVAAVLVTLLLAPALWKAQGMEGLLAAVAVGWVARAAVLISASFQKST